MQKIIVKGVVDRQILEVILNRRHWFILGLITCGSEMGMEMKFCGVFVEFSDFHCTVRCDSIVQSDAV